MLEHKSQMIRGFKWPEINYINVDKETLDRMSKEDIICGILYEMTFNGFTKNILKNSSMNFINDLGQ